MTFVKQQYLTMNYHTTTTDTNRYDLMWFESYSHYIYNRHFGVSQFYWLFVIVWAIKVTIGPLFPTSRFSRHPPPLSVTVSSVYSCHSNDRSWCLLSNKSRFIMYISRISFYELQLQLFIRNGFIYVHLRCIMLTFWYNFYIEMWFFICRNSFHLNRHFDWQYHQIKNNYYSVSEDFKWLSNWNRLSFFYCQFSWQQRLTSRNRALLYKKVHFPLKVEWKYLWTCHCCFRMKMNGKCLKKIYDEHHHHFYYVFLQLKRFKNQ